VKPARSARAGGISGRRPAAWVGGAVLSALALTTSAFPSPRTPAKSTPPTPLPGSEARGRPEARLIEIYRLIGTGQARSALAKAETLTRDVPNFQLAQLVYGDLLLARQGLLPTLGAAPPALAASSPDQLAQLRREASLRLAALTERPPAQRLPKQFLELPSTTRHAIAVDASRSRLYLFENADGSGLKLVADHYVSLGRSGVGKQIEGDQRTPLGVYFITSRLGGPQLKPFYGPGALTLNYPNEYDRRRGKTGSGIWLHGVPPENFARTPLTTDGCVVLANEDLMRLLREVEPRRTPVVITQQLEWATPHEVQREREAAQALVEKWRRARSSGDTKSVLALYSLQFTSGRAGLAEWAQMLDKERAFTRGRESHLKDVSILSWRDQSEVLVVTFGEVLEGQRTGGVRRQYWGKEGGQWKIFYEGVIG
jgi:murein L,D-transpeptidase YafK